jgi:hypothetical protein
MMIFPHNRPIPSPLRDYVFVVGLFPPFPFGNGGKWFWGEEGGWRLFVNLENDSYVYNRQERTIQVQHSKTISEGKTEPLGRGEMRTTSSRKTGVGE